MAAARRQEEPRRGLSLGSAQLDWPPTPRRDEHTLQAKSLHYGDFHLLFVILTFAREKAEKRRFLLPGHSLYRICRGQNDAVSKAHLTGSTSCAPWTTPSEGRSVPLSPGW